MELHTCLWNDVDAFDFRREDLQPLLDAHPDLVLHHHKTADSFLGQCADARLVLTWDFLADWYQYCPDLELILTPAAGNDWIQPDPQGHTRIEHGSFHGPILAESLLQAILFMNHRLPHMIANFKARGWDRNIQTKARLLSQQTVLIVGLGNIGSYCAEKIQQFGARVIGVKRTPDSGTIKHIPVFGAERLIELLPQADHVILLLPGNEETNRFMSPEKLKACKPGAIIYNFGRGNALLTEDLLQHWDHLGGAFLDVTDEEPLPSDSPLWELDNIMITPHSSCVYRDYRRLFIDEVIEKLNDYFRS